MAKDNLAILPFTGGQGDEGETIAELFSFERELTAAFNPVPRTSINRAIRGEQRFQYESGMTDPDTAAALGKQLGAQYVVSGSITALGSQKLLIVSILKIDDLRQIAGDIQTYTDIEEIEGKLPVMARSIAAAARADAAKLPRLAVPPVALSGGADPHAADVLARILAIHIIRGGKYAVYPRTASLEQIQDEYANQFSGDTADENLPSIGRGTNPELVLSVTARKLGSQNRFNAAIINLVTGVQEAGDSEGYLTLDDGITSMANLTRKLTGVSESSREFDNDMKANQKPAMPAQYTVTFNANGGSPSGRTKTVTDGAAVGAWNIPPNPTRSGYTFDGWYTDKNGGGSQFTGSTTVSGNITVYAKWTAASPLADLSLEAGLSWIETNAVEGGSYTITLRQNESIGRGTLSYSGKKVNVILSGDASERVISLSTKRALFTVESGVTLTLGNNITLQGLSDNADSLVRVNRGGTLVMNTGSKINGNTAASSYGGGVYVTGGTFTMSGGAISGNTATSFGGGVYVIDGTFMMSGGAISGNTSYSYGGGVSVYNGTFTMSGEAISGNTAYSYGGGVYVTGGTFTMSGGAISDNTASYGGGGVYVNGGTFIKQSGGAIYGSNAADSLKNTSRSNGGVVYVSSGSGNKQRNITVGEGVTLDSRTLGGWE
jgi:uncharacterized repeat protein (TIGR02543 family)